jgi:hypothetical protein
MATKLQEAEETINQLKGALEARAPTPVPPEISNRKDLISESTNPSQHLSPEEIQSDLSIDSQGQVRSPFCNECCVLIWISYAIMALPQIYIVHYPCSQNQNLPTLTLELCSLPRHKRVEHGKCSP